MKSNWFALKTLRYIWLHPNCKGQQISAIARFFGWQFYKRLTRKRFDFQLISNIKLRCYPDSRSAAAALYCGLYDYDEMSFLLRYLRSTDCFLDVGANIGIYTLLAASKISTGKIYSIEVLPKNYDRLRENIQLNQLQQVTTWAIAVSNQPGTIELAQADGDSLPFMTYMATASTISVITETLDTLLQQESIAQLALAKIDIEGAELLAFQGATTLLKQHRPAVWILEINDAVKRFGYDKQAVVDFLQSYGYELYRYQADCHQLEPIKLAQQMGDNVLAIADSQLAFVCERLNQKI
jgi:FkbM family methyltransferase